ncbi:MAG TPA: c-type cytochrome biogenesis protein CcmF [Gammaproteobacteria bacterium]|jgi:cytochrome c-type biogenesis protein CcmF|nr:c-type cytochrome biogenesis protein CcmF [Gammaproteobacteria bacterium]|tara:strand:- start:123 stop:2105 length:1983 start_codon:yes stop_codon:yes gene_type:complete
MIAELGNFSLILALAMACIQSFFPIVGASQGNQTWMSLARPVARLQFLFVLIAFVLLVYLFLVNDFSIAYVANNSNTLLPWFYRFSAVWGAHEGSLLLWVLILNIWTIAVTFFSRRLPEYFLSRVIGVMGAISIGFLMFMLFTSNPFTRLFPVPLDGADLNPLLQDPGLIIHPPVLYMGYVGFSVAFSFAIAALLAGNLDTTWARWSRPWTLLAWIFLTLGIALGSWWAYYELGWGGWWFWDPVENASFMPWLIGTALIHSLAATDKRGIFKNWTILLAICAFALSLLGTFLVRSGVITSVHAFATDPTRGIFILALLGFFVGGSLVLYAINAPSTERGGKFKLLSRETFLLLNSILFLVAMLTVLLGTIYPLIIEALDLGKLSVGPPYFNAVFVPIMSPLIIFVGLAVITKWKQDNFQKILKQLRILLVSSLLVGTCIGLIFFTNNQFKSIAGIVAALWISSTTIYSLFIKIKNKKNKLAALMIIPRSFYGMLIAHIGFAVCIVGITITSQHSIDVHKRMKINDTVEFADYKFYLKDLKTLSGPNYKATEAVVNVIKNEKLITTLRSQKRMYTVRNMPMTEAGIDAGFTRDIYMALGEPLDDDSWSIRLYHKPFVRWIWLGAILMALGGVLAITDRRYRLEKITKKAPSISNEAISTIK